MSCLGIFSSKPKEKHYLVRPDHFNEHLIQSPEIHDKEKATCIIRGTKREADLEILKKLKVFHIQVAGPAVYLDNVGLGKHHETYVSHNHFIKFKLPIDNIAEALDKARYCALFRQAIQQLPKSQRDELTDELDHFERQNN